MTLQPRRDRRVAAFALAAMFVALTGCDPVPLASSADADAGEAGTSGDGAMADAGDASPVAIDRGAAAKASAVWASCVGGANAQALLARGLGSSDGIVSGFVPSSLAAPPSGWLSALDRAFFFAAFCLASATDGCNALMRCAGISSEALPSGCVSQCNADGKGSLDLCTDRRHVRLPCAGGPFGVLGTCDVPSADCVLAGVTSCIADTPVACESGRLGACRGGLRDHGPACAAFGLSCDTDALRGPGCLGGGALCTTVDPLDGPLSLRFSGDGCDGSKVRRCQGGELGSLDCHLLDPSYSCQSIVSGAATHAFCGVDRACDPSAAPSCDGKVLTLCAAGEVKTVDCTSLGFAGGCDATAGVCIP